MSEQDKDDLRKDFELTLLFNHPGFNPPRGRVGCLKKKEDGTYKSAYVEAVYTGYLIGRADRKGQAKGTT